jgi:hypothetical protein
MKFFIVTTIAVALWLYVIADQKRKVDQENATMRAEIANLEQPKADSTAPLATCFSIADQEKFDTLRINGTVHKDGSIWTPIYIQQQANADKQMAYDECRALYGGKQ